MRTLEPSDKNFAKFEKILRFPFEAHKCKQHHTDSFPWEMLNNL